MALSVALAVILLLLVAQLVLPVIAARIVRGRLEAHGQVISVSVSAFPAIELLWGHAGKVNVRMASYNAPPEEVTGELQQADDVGTLNVSIQSLHTGLLQLHDVGLTKRGSEIDVGAQLELKDLQNAVPFLQSVTPVSSVDGELTLRGTAGVFGTGVTATAVVAARDGKVVVAPAGLLGSFATVTVFDDPRLYVEGVSGEAVRGGLFVSARGRFT